MIAIQCDTCKKELTDLNYFQIEGLQVKNYLYGAKILTLDSSNTFHFCSKKCLGNFFFQES